MEVIKSHIWLLWPLWDSVCLYTCEMRMCTIAYACVCVFLYTYVSSSVYVCMPGAVVYNSSKWTAIEWACVHFHCILHLLFDVRFYWFNKSDFSISFVYLSGLPRCILASLQSCGPPLSVVIALMQTIGLPPWSLRMADQQTTLSACAIVLAGWSTCARQQCILHTYLLLWWQAATAAELKQAHDWSLSKKEVFIEHEDLPMRVQFCQETYI